MFFIIAMSIMISLCVYTGMRIIKPAGLKPAWSGLLWIMLFLICFMPVIILIPKILQIDFRGIVIISWISYTGLGFLSMVIAFLILKDNIMILRRIYKKFFNRQKPQIIDCEDDPPDCTRRRFIKNSINLGILGVSGILTGCGMYEARRDPRVEKIKIHLPNLPASFDGFRIIQITDIHAGDTIGRDFVETIAKIVNNLNPDLVAITGDIVDGTVHELRDIVSPLSDLESKHGTYFVTGNHEYYSGVESWIPEFRKMNMTVLMNEHVVIKSGKQQIILAGVTDYSGRSVRQQSSSPVNAVKGTGEHDVKILLAHQPRSIYEASKAGIDLQLSGHTHGGQYYPYTLFVRLQQPFINGLNKYKDTVIYVSRGTGYWGPPMRLGVPSEITEITLTG